MCTLIRNMAYLVELFLVLIICVFGNCDRGLSFAHLRHMNSSLPYTVQTEYEIPVMFHLDQPLLQNLLQISKTPRSQIKKIMYNILNQVQKNYDHSSLMQKMKFTFLGLRFLRNNTRFYKIDENGSNYLRSYCDWQRGMKKKRRKWYYSVLITGINIYYLNRGNKIWSGTGRSYRNGVCNLSKSCALVEWKPQNLAHLLTHEIGHSLGLPHDGQPNNQCKQHGYIMSPKYNTRRHSQVWSPCSRNSLKKFLTSDRALCLRDKFDYSII